MILYLPRMYSFQRISKFLLEFSKMKSKLRVLEMLLLEKYKGVAIDPTCINTGRLERTNLMYFKWAVT